MVPNETLLLFDHEHVGELVQSLCDQGWEYGTSVELDVSDKTKPGEQRGGASPPVVLAIFVLEAAAHVVMERIFDAALTWLRKHFRDNPETPIIVIYGPDGSVLREVRLTDEDA